MALRLHAEKYSNIWTEIRSLINECRNASDKCKYYYKEILPVKYPDRNRTKYDAGGCKKDDNKFYTMYGGCRQMLTGTVWGHSPSAKATYSDAISYCTDNDFNGERGWRLPNSSDVIAVSGKENVADHIDIELKVNRYWTMNKKVADILHGIMHQPIDETNAPYGVVCIRSEQY